VKHKSFFLLAREYLSAVAHTAHTQSGTLKTVRLSR